MAGEPRVVRARAGVPVAGMLAALFVGAVAGCHRSASRNPSSSDRKPSPPVVKSAPRPCRRRAIGTPSKLWPKGSSKRSRSMTIRGPRPS